MPFALGSVAPGRWFVMNRCITTHHSLNTAYLSTTYSSLPLDPGYSKRARFRLRAAAQLGQNYEGGDYEEAAT